MKTPGHDSGRNGNGYGVCVYRGSFGESLLLKYIFDLDMMNDMAFYDRVNIGNPGRSRLVCSDYPYSKSTQANICITTQAKS